VRATTRRIASPGSRSGVLAAKLWVDPHGGGIWRSRQIFSARYSLMLRWRGTVENFARDFVDVNRMAAAFAQKTAAMSFQVPDQIDALHCTSRLAMQ